jgi:hypothetical protein
LRRHGLVRRLISRCASAVRASLGLFAAVSSACRVPARDARGIARRNGRGLQAFDFALRQRQVARQPFGLGRCAQLFKRLPRPGQRRFCECMPARPRPRPSGVRLRPAPVRSRASPSAFCRPLQGQVVASFVRSAIAVGCAAACVVVPACACLQLRWTDGIGEIALQKLDLPALLLKRGT